jgi:hypothetical protein
MPYRNGTNGLMLACTIESGFSAPCTSLRLRHITYFDSVCCRTRTYRIRQPKSLPTFCACSPKTFSLFSQYAFTVAGVVGGSGYAIHRKPPNGLGLMLVAGAAGTMADFGYAWFVSCRTHKETWLEARRVASLSTSDETQQAQNE